MKSFPPLHNRPNTWLPAAAPAAEMARAHAYAHRIALDLAANTGYSDDILSEAMVGLVEAVNRFDPDAGFRLSTYAYKWMRGRATRAVARELRYRSSAPTVLRRSVETTGPIRDAAETLGLLRQTERLLTRSEQSILRKHYFEDQSLAVIARKHHWTHAGTVRRHDRMLQRLRRWATPSTDGPAQ